MFPIIRLGGSLNIPTYFLVICFAATVSLLWADFRLKKTDLSRRIGLDLCLILMVSGFLGARLFHITYESLAYYQSAPERVFYVWDGGFVFYGGAIVSVFATWVFLRFKDPARTLQYYDLFAAPIALSYCLGRIGCFLAGCCYGKSCDLPWAVLNKHPTQLYAVLWEAGVILVLLGVESIPRSYRRPAALSKTGAIFFLWMILHGIGRILMEAFRDDFRGPSLGFSISTWLSAMIVSLGILLLLWSPSSWQKR